jgi:uncharacterized protein (TIGR02285 family)
MNARRLGAPGRASRSFSLPLRAIVLSVAMICLSPHRCLAQNEIIWAVADRPTSFILHGPEKGRGVVDEVYALLQAALPEYKHTNMEMTFGRAVMEMRSGRDVCACGFKTPEREMVALFSRPAVLSLPYAVVTRKGGRLERHFGDAKSVNLQILLSDDRFKGGVMQKRSYDEATELVSKFEEDGTLATFTPSSDVVRLLLSGRVDYVIEIPSFLHYKARGIGAEDQITSYGIDEIKSKVLAASIFCVKDETGEELMQKINGILRQAAPTQRYKDIQVRWFDSHAREFILENYGKLLEE